MKEIHCPLLLNLASATDLPSPRWASVSPSVKLIHSNSFYKEVLRIHVA